MKKISLFVLIFFCFFASSPLFAGERTIPVDLFIMIDKSLSMAEPGKFESLHEWVQDQLIGQMLIDGDWITIYQFYGKTTNLLTMDVKTPADREKIVKTINAITPDGQYTDIGLALDTMKKALAARGKNDRHKVMLLLTDLKQEAPWTSRYAGSQETYNNPYLAEARQVKHDNWYEITLDMDIQDSVVKTSHELYASIKDQLTHDTPRTLPAGNGERLDSEGPAAGSGGKASSAAGTTSGEGKNAASTAKSGTLPLLPLLVVVSVIFVGCIALVPVVLKSRRKKEEQTKSNT